MKRIITRRLSVDVHVIFEFVCENPINQFMRSFDRIFDQSKNDEHFAIPFDLCALYVLGETVYESCTVC